MYKEVWKNIALVVLLVALCLIVGNRWEDRQIGNLLVENQRLVMIIQQTNKGLIQIPWMRLNGINGEVAIKYWQSLGYDVKFPEPPKVAVKDSAKVKK